MALSAFGALLLGIATVFGFAPFGASALPILTLAGLFALWRQAATPRAAGCIGFAFGAGLFGAGVSWVYVALSAFGEMPPVLAAMATVCFCAYLALFPALVGWCSARLAPIGSGVRLVLAAPLWTLAEWLRSWLLSGFTWLSIGYSEQTAALAGYAPIGGVLLVSLAIASAAALLVHAALAVEERRLPVAAIDVAALLAAGAVGVALSTVEWSRPAEELIAVSLVQGNIPQDVKFDPQYRASSLSTYADLVARAKGRLIVLPESALPMFADEVPADYVAGLREVARKNGGDILLGLFFFEPRTSADEDDRYFNTVVSVGAATTQVYRKRHLVPFGETIPLKPLFGWFIRGVLNIPLADQTPGPAYQEAFAVAGERVAVNICYEDAFSDVINRSLPEATLLVNVTNDAWYGRSLAAEQHEQIAAMRALETSRPMLRATNTGITSIIDHHGAELARLPWFSRGVLEGRIAGRTGTTPYVRFGDTVVVLAALLLVGAALLIRRLA
ncbi:MAG TPA: apolipoprotein N-acyltransferase [Casimicrobiaceae bacterium]|nr:apolipoprotein N-acyltransferase [Casimicrobiaceae bacterium]